MSNQPAVSGKHILNSPSSLVVDSLEGLCAFNPFLALESASKVVHVAAQDRSKVALICGGGSGHEPAHCSFVGAGMLTAAVCGNIFASPNASQVRCAIDLVDNDEGTVIIVKNYTGDVLNFGLAREQYAACYPSKSDRVKFVVVGDDVAVGRTQGSIVGRRGLAGTVLVYKIAGALAERGASVDEVYVMAKWVSSHLVTIGVGLDHCHIPGTAATGTYLSSDEIEIGTGIHNESGYRRISPIPPLHKLVTHLLDLLVSTTDEERSYLPFQGGKDDNVVLLVNNLGGLSELELASILAETRRALDKTGMIVHRILSGSFMTSLNMPGFSLTLLLLPPVDDTHIKPVQCPSSSLILSLLDDPCTAPGWRWSSKTAPSPTSKSTSVPAPVAEARPFIMKLKVVEPHVFTDAIARACKSLIDAEPKLSRMDFIAGDGDCGITLKHGAEVILAKILDGSIHGNDIVGSIINIAQVAERDMGGTSGGLYSIFFSALAQGLQNSSSPVIHIVTKDIWCSAISFALSHLYTYTLARPPSRTLVDPLAAFVQTLPDDFNKAVEAAGHAAERTRELDAKVGRSAYIDKGRLREDMVPDPGAWGVKLILEGLQG